MMFFMQIERLIIRGARVVGLIGLAGFQALAFIIVLDVLMRWFFNAPIAGVRDAGSLLIAIIMAASFPACCAARGNVSIRFLGKVLGRRGEDALDILGNVLILIFFTLAVWQTWLYSNELALNNETTMVLGWPMSPWWRAVSILMAFCIPVQIVVVYQLAMSALTGRSTLNRTPASTRDTVEDRV
jgi:TRAP-type C4-dicarboxylate transport system permease small subunit